MAEFNFRTQRSAQDLWDHCCETDFMHGFLSGLGVPIPRNDGCEDEWTDQESRAIAVFLRQWAGAIEGKGETDG